MANFLYVDNSNVWIEGMRVSAVQNGLAPDIWTATDQRILDQSWKIDFGRLHEFAGGERGTAIGRSILYGSRPPANDSLWDAAKRSGFEVVVFDRNLSNREKKVDTQLAADVMEDSYTRMAVDVDEVTLVAGDADYVPVVEKLVARGYPVTVLFWSHASRELREAAAFIPLDGYLDHLRRSD